MIPRSDWAGPVRVFPHRSRIPDPPPHPLSLTLPVYHPSSPAAQGSTSPAAKSALRRVRHRRWPRRHHHRQLHGVEGADRRPPRSSASPRTPMTSRKSLFS
ncbi:hypothetical protein DAI22_11g192600 [Oryza sativa Japonica Group]|nr:hypothetical protein DAI22_11g192600 [Oryza sativa Japonica Group]